MSDPQETPLNDAQAASPPNPAPQAGADDGEEFDKERALSTIRKLRDFEKQAKQQLRELAELKKAQAETEAAKMSDLEKAQKELATLREHAAAKEAALRLERAARAVADEAGKFNLPAKAATRLISPDALEYDDSGAPKVGSVRAALKALAEDMPELVAQARTANPARGGADTASEEQQWRERLFGNAGLRIFDKDWAASHGGGAFFSTDKD